MKIAIIGATGFLGSNILKLIPKKYEIIATYVNKEKKRLKKKNIKWKFLDIHKRDKFYNYLNKPEIIIHLGWSNLPNYKLKYHLQKELPSQKKFIYDLVSSGLKNIFIAGTCFEYGYQEGKLSEKNFDKPNNYYSKAKCELKNYVIKLNKKFEFKFIWGRIFYIYGKHNSRDTLFNQIIKSSKKNGKKINVTGNLIRDYLHIKEISKIIIKLSFLKKNIGLINICSGKALSLKNLVKKIANENKIKPKINFTKTKNNNIEPNKFWGCNRKLKFYLKKNNEKVKK